jgi:hypothetical protein
MDQIGTLKAQLKRQYAHYKRVTPDYDCGHAMMKEVNVEYSLACRELNATLNKLAAVDPDTPKTRF